MRFFDGFHRARDFYALAGSLRFWYLSLGVLVVIFSLSGIYIWLSRKIGWPENYGFSCHRKCLIDNMWHSPALLNTGNGYELGLFAFIWFMPTIIFCAAIYALIKRRKRGSILTVEPDK
jgi:hypothetical protein